MVHEYSFDAARRVIRVRLSDVLTKGALLEMLLDLQRDPRVTAECCALIDLRGVRSAGQIHQHDIRAIAANHIAAVPRCAFVAHDPAVFGLCRMWATLRELADDPQPVGVFRSLRDADAWLASVDDA